jgi:hypothetical protein
MRLSKLHLHYLRNNKRTMQIPKGQKWDQLLSLAKDESGNKGNDSLIKIMTMW